MFGLDLESTYTVRIEFIDGIGIHFSGNGGETHPDWDKLRNHLFKYGLEEGY